MADGKSNQNQIGEASIKVVVDYSDVEKEALKAVRAAQQAANNAKSSGGSGSTTNGGVSSVPSGPSTVAGTPPPAVTVGNMPGAGGIGTGGFGGIPSGFSSAVSMAVSAQGARSVAETLVQSQEANFRQQLYETQLQQSGIDRGFMRARRNRELGVSGLTAMGVPEMIARGGIGPNQQRARDEYQDERRRILDEASNDVLSLPTPGRFALDYLSDVVSSPIDLITGNGLMSRSRADSEAVSRFGARRASRARNLRNLDQSQSTTESRSQMLDMILMMQQQNLEAASMRLEAPR